MERVEITKGTKEAAKNFLAIKGHPDLVWEPKDRILVDLKTGKSIAITKDNEKFEVYIGGKYKTISSILGEIK